MVNQIEKIAHNAQDVTKAARSVDIEEVARIMMQYRRTGLAPSDTVTKGLSYAEIYVQDEFPELSMRAKMKLSAHIWEEASKIVGVHAQEKRAAKEAPKL